MFPNGWYNQLQDHLHSESFRGIARETIRLQKQGVELTPKIKDTFRAFVECPYDRLHTIILGMDPYPGKVDKNNYVADGIAFSSRYSKTCPKSLNYLLEVIDRDIYDGKGYHLTQNFDLTRWANQGILLLNCALSLPIKEKSGFHIPLWHPFITYVLQTISRKDNIGVILMGGKAKEYQYLLKNPSWAIYTCEHPSAANYHGGNWRDEGVFKALVAYHKAINNIKINW